MKQILIFDDDEDTLFLYTYVLKKENWKVTTFVDCNNIIDTLTQHKADLIIMDNAIPDEGGLEATKKIKSSTAYKNIPVIFSSANLQIEALAKLAGADAYLKKPFDVNELKLLADKLMNKL